MSFCKMSQKQCFLSVLVIFFLPPPHLLWRSFPPSSEGQPDVVISLRICFPSFAQTCLLKNCKSQRYLRDCFEAVIVSSNENVFYTKLSFCLFQVCSLFY